MTFKLVCIVNAVLAFGFGITFVFAAGPTIAMYGATLSPGGLVVARLLGAIFLTEGVITLQARDVAGAPGDRPRHRRGEHNRRRDRHPRRHLRRGELPRVVDRCDLPDLGGRFRRDGPRQVLGLSPLSIRETSIHLRSKPVGALARFAVPRRHGLFVTTCALVGKSFRSAGSAGPVAEARIACSLARLEGFEPPAF